MGQLSEKKEVIEKSAIAETAAIAEFLGLRQPAKDITELRLARVIEEGLGIRSFDTLTRKFGEDLFVDRLVSTSTLRRTRESRKKKFSPAISDKLYRAVRVLTIATRVFGNDEKAALRFLTKPHQLLDSETPLDLASESSAGSDLVIKILRRANAGFAV